MVRTAWWVLRQRRYARLAVLMVFIAAGCVAAGTWQISRYEQTARINRGLTANARAAAVPFASLRVPLVGAGPAPGREAIRYRTVTVSGTYIPGAQLFLRDQSVAGRSGFYVVNPLRTDAGVLMIVRGFVPGDGDSTRPPAVALPAPGVQQAVGRLQTPATTSDAAGELSDDEITSVNPADQARRLATPVVNAYLTLSGRQSGNAGLTVLPAPDLSNPAGGAVEPQHLAYIVQWYLFALLALAAPFAIARSEVREARRTYLGIDPDAGDFGAEFAVAPPEAAPSADGASTDGVVAVRERGELMRREAAQVQRLARAERLASRYGRSLTTGHDGSPEPPADPDPDAGLATRAPDYVSANSADRPHRSPDAYHGLYNDYLWQLAMADGDLPRVAVPADDPTPRSVIDAVPTPRPTLPPTIIAPDGRVVATSVEPTEQTPAAGTQEDDAPDRSDPRERDRPGSDG
jgi:cytochrome oxidase assembly protein ShyY1